VTLARTVSNTFAGIRPVDAPGFIAAQLIGAATATVMFRWMLSPSSEKLPSDEDSLLQPSEEKRTSARSASSTN
jgi:glycerol uptake facilitator-like aquaporin